MHTFISVILWFLMGTLCSYLARQRGRDPAIWFFLGMLLGILGVIVLFILPDLSKTEKPVQEEQEALYSESQISPEIRFPQWFYLDKEKKAQGPFSFEQFSNLWKEGVFNEEAYVWKEGMAKWEKVSQIPLLLGTLDRFLLET